MKYNFYCVLRWLGVQRDRCHIWSRNTALPYERGDSGRLPVKQSQNFDGIDDKTTL